MYGQFSYGQQWRYRGPVSVAGAPITPFFIVSAKPAMRRQDRYPYHGDLSGFACEKN
jgi:hypothetical protein